ncbi:MAG: alanine--glyoxylate aminotransferase family protein [Gemmataceae bacterium]|nr:alanine--glyoxylate aminotransferase family protein [Gemmataceae bacterium]MDW8265781.1 alanine--glyoxylate aminotransferase family protein [Gemmataceae bacterium]
MKPRLLTPGPTPVPEETLLDLAKPVVFHRTPEFRQALAEVLADLQYVFQTKNLVLPLTSSGTGGLEAAVANCIPPGKKAICLIAGRFGERWRGLCKAFGIEPIAVTVPYGEAVAPEQLAKALADHPDAVAVCCTLSETSTGVAHDVAAFGRLVAPTPALLLVDSISGLGAMECRTDDWHIDVNITGSQKALMLPPGLAFLSVSAKAWAAIEANTQARVFYFDLKKARAALQTSDTPYTPAHTLIMALRHSLKRIRAEGIENVWARQALHARAARAGFQAMGLKLFAARPADGLTVVRMPEGIDSTTLLGKLEKRYGLKLANGQDQLKGKIIRLAHMGYIDQFDILAALAGVELVLREMGHPVDPGVGVAAAQRVFAEAVSAAGGRS